MIKIRYHCYQVAPPDEGPTAITFTKLQVANVSADTPRQAAVKAAELTGADGTWIVTPGQPVEVLVRRAVHYEAVTPETALADETTIKVGAP